MKSGQEYDFDFDHQFIETEKYDAKPTYKKFLGYSPGVACFTFIATPRAEANMSPSRFAPLKQASKNTVTDLDGKLPNALYRSSKA